MQVTQELNADQEYKDAEAALSRLQEKLATLPGWRDSLAWEVVERCREELGHGWFDAYCYHSKPAAFRHWREKYSDGDM